MMMPANPSVTPFPIGRYAAAFVGGALANLCVLFRFLTYHERNNLPPSTFLLFAGVCFLVGFGVTFGSAGSRFRIASCVLAGVCAAQMAVIVSDWQKDPTDHNLFPFELAYLCLAASPAYLGALSSRILAGSK